MSSFVDIQLTTKYKELNPKFDEYFLSIYKERWPLIFQAMLTQEIQTLRLNKFCDVNQLNFEQLESNKGQSLQKDFLPQLKRFFKNENCHNKNASSIQFFQLLKQCFNVTQASTHNLADSNDVLAFYKMDPASVIVAGCLDVQPDDLVLDLCAAPGGKSLILAEALNANYVIPECETAGDYFKYVSQNLKQAQMTGEQISNEYSPARRDRLARVIKEYLPHDLRQNIYVQGKDGNLFGKDKAGIFDRVLADVPCSGERHLLENQDEFKQWTKRRSENLAIRQYSLLSSAYLSARQGARLVYSTCSISPLENDDVIKKLVKKREVQILELDWLKQVQLANGECFIEKTQYGYQVLPDRCGFGPMYFSVIQKI